jgi:hypothetical protein
MKQLIVILIIGILFIGCEKDDCKKIGMVQIEEIVMADTVLLNESTNIKVKASATSGCWSNLFVDLREEDIFEYSIKAYGTLTCCEGGCICPTVMVYQDTTLKFQPIPKGTYIFQITKNLNTIDTDTLIVK